MFLYLQEFSERLPNRSHGQSRIVEILQATATQPEEYGSHIEVCSVFLRYSKCDLRSSSRAFATFDQNHDGTIDFREFILTIAANMTNDLDTRLKIVFETYGDLLVDHG